MPDKVVSYWPELYQDIREFKLLAEAEDSELALAEQALLLLLDDQFVETGSMEAIKRRERMLGIQADPAVETMEFRRRRIVNRYSTKPPFTIRYLQERLDFLAGAGRGIASVDTQHFILTVRAAIDDAAIFQEVERTVFAIKPSNLIYQQQTGIENRLVLEEHILTNTLKRNVRLGVWRLGIAAFADPEAEVIVK